MQDRQANNWKRFILRLFLPLVVALSALNAQADSREQIDSLSREVLQQMQQLVPGSDKLLQEAVGVLVFPDMVKMGFGAGGQFGEGALMVGDDTVAYYATAGAEFGLPLGASRKSQVLFFMSKEALQNFRGSVGWEVGVNGEVHMLDLDEEGRLDESQNRGPVLAVIFTERTMVRDLDLAGSKMSRIAR